MKSTTPPKPPTGTIWLSPIVLSYDVSTPTAKSLVLGIVGEIETGWAKGLGLLARTKLTDAELIGLELLPAKVVARPFDFLKADFDWAWDRVGRGGALRALASKHHTAISLAMTFESVVPRQYCAESESVTALESYFIDELHNKMLELVWNEPDTFRQSQDARTHQAPAQKKPSTSQRLQWEEEDLAA